MTFDPWCVRLVLAPPLEGGIKSAAGDPWGETAWVPLPLPGLYATCQLQTLLLLEGHPALVGAKCQEPQSLRMAVIRPPETSLFYGASYRAGG